MAQVHPQILERSQKKRAVLLSLPSCMGCLRKRNLTQIIFHLLFGVEGLINGVARELEEHGPEDLLFFRLVLLEVRELDHKELALAVCFLLQAQGGLVLVEALLAQALARHATPGLTIPPGKVRVRVFSNYIFLAPLENLWVNLSHDWT